MGEKPLNRSEVQAFARLFRGRTDAHGTEEGGAARRPVNEFTYLDHLTIGGEKAIGIYPLVKLDGRFVVPWGCTDIDLGEEESQRQARNLTLVLRRLGITAWIETSRSKGYHVWVFVDGWVGATEMRHALLFAHEIAEVPATEVNPKQTDDARLAKGFGNYVRLPYPHGTYDTMRRVVHQWPHTADVFPSPMLLQEFTRDALDRLNSPETIEKVAALYTPPPPPPRVDIDGEYSGELEPLVKELSGLAFTIFTGGPLEGADRSTTLSRLAVKIAEGGRHQPNEALALLVDADRRWGKFYDRPDGDEQLARIVQWAYAETMTNGGTT